ILDWQPFEQYTMRQWDPSLKLSHFMTLRLHPQRDGTTLQFIIGKFEGKSIKAWLYNKLAPMMMKRDENKMMEPITNKIAEDLEAGNAAVAPQIKLGVVERLRFRWRRIFSIVGELGWITILGRGNPAPTKKTWLIRRGIFVCSDSCSRLLTLVAAMRLARDRLLLIAAHERVSTFPQLFFPAAPTCCILKARLNKGSGGAMNPRALLAILFFSIFALSACAGDSQSAIDTAVAQTQQISQLETAAAGGGATSVPPGPEEAATPVAITHVMMPGAPPTGGKLFYDVDTSGTAPQQRAPYGDSWDRNLLERPFEQDMVYVPDLDIIRITVASDPTWWYVSVRLIGADPNNALGINYGVELDLDRDGFGDYIIWARPPYTDQWETAPVQIFQDLNHNTGGLSSTRSDAPFDADGYETLIFDGSLGGDDPDMAWVRINAGADAAVQFAFKKSWSGTVFMLGVIADASLKDPGQLDYVDRFTIAEAGSPVRDNSNYPLKELFLVDNSCREAFGFIPTGNEPQSCPLAPTPTRAPGPQPTACYGSNECCDTDAGYYWSDETNRCELFI
ncbi:MAG: hypothetical protein ACREH4_16750, partial [Vitreimonas sp.]